jgi:hypothetical protein
MGDDLASARPFRFDFLVPVSDLREKAQFADSTAARMPRESFAGNEFTEILRLLLPGEMGQNVGWTFFQISQRTDFITQKYAAMLKSSKQDQRTRAYRP